MLLICGPLDRWSVNIIKILHSFIHSMVSTLQQYFVGFPHSNIPTCDIASTLSLDIIQDIIPPKIEIPHCDTYNGKDYTMTCENMFMAKLFVRNFQDKALQWYFSLPPYSIDSFQNISNALIQQFQSNIYGPLFRARPSGLLSVIGLMFWLDFFCLLSALLL